MQSKFNPTAQYLICLISVIFLAGCASTTPPDVTAVAVAINTPLPPPQAVDLGTYGLGAAYEAAWSPDGTMLAVLSSAGVYVYETVNWKIIASLPADILSEEQRFSTLVFFPDGQRILLASTYSKGLWQYDLQNGDISPAYENLIQDEPSDAPLFSPDGNLLAFGGRVCNEDTHSCVPILRLYNASTGELIRNMPEGGLTNWEDMEAYAFSPDSALLATGGEDDVVRVWDVATGSLKYTLQQESDIKSIAFSLDGSVLVSAGRDAAVRFWGVKNGRSLSVLYGTMDEFYQYAAYINNGRSLLINDFNGVFKTYGLDENHLPLAALDIRFETEERLMREMGRYIPELVIRANPKADRMALIVNGNVQIWDLQTGKKTYTLPEYIREVYEIAFSPDENLLAVADHNIHLWQVQPKEFIGTLEVNGDQIMDIAFRPNGKEAAFALRNGRQVEIWDVTLRKKIQTFEIECSSGNSGYSENTQLAYAPDGKKLAIAVACAINLVDADTGVLLEQFPNDVGTPAELAFSADGGALIHVSVYGRRAWNLATGEQLYSIKRIDDYQPSAAIEGSLIAISNWNEVIRFFDAFSGKRLYEFPDSEGGAEIAFSPDGRMLAVDNYSKISLLDSTSGAELLSMKFSLPYTFSFSPNGTYLGARSYFENVHVWDVSAAMPYAQALPLQTATPNPALTPTTQPTPSPAPTLALSIPTAPAVADQSALAEHVKQIRKLGELGMGRMHTTTWSADGKLLAVGGYPGAYVFEVGSAQPAQFLPATNDLLLMQFSSDGQYLAGQMNNEAILLWDVKTGKTLQRLKNIGCWNQQIRFSEDNQLLIADCGNLIYTWHIPSGFLVNKETKNLKNDSLAGPYMYRAGMRSVLLIHKETGEIVKTFEIPGYAPSLARFSPNGKTIAVWHYQYAIARTGVYYPVENSKTILQLWNIAPDQPPTLRAELTPGIWHQDLMILESFRGLAFSPDSHLLATASGDGSTQIWNVSSGRLLHTLPNGNLIFFSPDGNYLTTLDTDSARVWEVSQSPRVVWEISGFNRWSYQIAFAQDGKELASATDEYYKFFNLTDTSATAPIRQIHMPGVRGHNLAISPDGALLFGAYTQTDQPSEMYLWDTCTGKLVRQWTAQFYKFAFHPTQPLFVGADFMSGIIRFFDLRTGNLAKEIRASQYVRYMAFSPDGSLLALEYESRGQGEGRIEIRDAETLALLNVIPASSNLFAFSPDGNTLVIANGDGRIEYWGWR